MKAFKKGISISGAVARLLIGIGATAMLFLIFKKEKTKKTENIRE